MKLLKHLTLATMLAALIAPAAKADDAKATSTIQIASINELLDSAEYMAKSLGKEEEAKGILEFARSLIDKEKGIAGIDPSRTIAVSLEFGENAEQPKFVVMVPILSQDALMSELKTRAGIAPEKGDDGVYSLEEGPAPVFFRFSGKTLFLTALDKGSIDPKKLPDPSKLPALKKGVLIGSQSDSSKIPDDLKKLTIGQMETMAATFKEKNDDLTDAQIKLKNQAIDLGMQLYKRMLYETGVSEFALKLDRSADQLALEIDTAASKGSKLADQLAELGKWESVAAPLKALPNLAARGNLSIAIPPQLRKSFEAAIEEGVKQLKLNLPPDAPKASLDLIDALVPTFKMGEIQGGFALSRGETQHGDVLGIVKLKDGKKVEGVIANLIESMQKANQPGADLVKLNAMKVGDVGVHVFDMETVIKEKDKKFFGEKPKLAFAFKDGAVFIAVGERATKLIGSAIEGKPAAMPLLGFEVDVANGAAFSPDLDPETLKKLSEEAFGPKGGGKIRLSIEAGESIKLRGSIDLKAIKFFLIFGMMSKEEN